MGANLLNIFAVGLSRPVFVFDKNVDSYGMTKVELQLVNDLPCSKILMHKAVNWNISPLNLLAIFFRLALANTTASSAIL
jgi:hypothetical protein